MHELCRDFALVVGADGGRARQICNFQIHFLDAVPSNGCRRRLLLTQLTEADRFVLELVKIAPNGRLAFSPYLVLFEY